jgi:hypothetical protein
MFVCCECCVLSGRGLCDGVITRPEEPLCVIKWIITLLVRYTEVGLRKKTKQQPHTHTRARTHTHTHTHTHVACNFYRDVKIIKLHM